jgi:DNA-binding transcriptional ArsR family regulator
MPSEHDRMRRISQGDRADRGARWNRGDQPYVDAQTFTELDTRVYEAVATLEYAGRPVTAGEVAEATGLDAPAVGEILGALTDHGVLTRRQADAGDAFELARRDWSATPERRSR